MTPRETPQDQERLSGLARIAFAGLIWGTIPLVLRAADGASSVKVFFRVGCAALVIWAWMLLRGDWRELRALDAGRWRQLVLQGLILALNWFLFLTALDLTDVATAELLAYTAPVLVAVLGPAITGERFDPRIVLPLALALGGIALILLQHGLAIDDGGALLGAGLALASALTYATLMLRAKRLLRGVSSGALMLVEYTAASLILTPFVISAYSRGDVPSSARAYAALVTLGVVHTAISGFIFLGGLRRVRTDHAAVLTYVEPVSAVLFAALFLGEPLTALTVLGGACVVLGGVLVARIEPAPGIEVPEAVIAERPIEGGSHERT